MNTQSLLLFLFADIVFSGIIPILAYLFLLKFWWQKRSKIKEPQFLLIPVISGICSAVFSIVSFYYIRSWSSETIPTPEFLVTVQILSIFGYFFILINAISFIIISKRNPETFNNYLSLLGYSLILILIINLASSFIVSFLGIFVYFFLNVVTAILYIRAYNKPYKNAKEIREKDYACFGYSLKFYGIFILAENIFGFFFMVLFGNYIYLINRSNPSLIYISILFLIIYIIKIIRMPRTLSKMPQYAAQYTPQYPAQYTPQYPAQYTPQYPSQLPQKPMRSCPHCNIPNFIESKFCVNCGRKIDSQSAEQIVLQKKVQEQEIADKKMIEQEKLEKQRLEQERLEKERQDKEYLEQDRLDPKKDKERKENLINLFQISDRININDVATIMDLPRAEVVKKLIEWKNIAQFRIDGDYIRIEKGDISNIISVIDKSFDEWSSDLKRSQKKL